MSNPVKLPPLVVELTLPGSKDSLRVINSMTMVSGSGAIFHQVLGQFDVTTFATNPEGCSIQFDKILRLMLLEQCSTIFEAKMQALVERLKTDPAALEEWVNGTTTTTTSTTTSTTTTPAPPDPTSTTTTTPPPETSSTTSTTTPPPA